VHVAIILMKHGFDEEVAIAGLLHDVVEDCNVSIDAIRTDFGDRVAELVAGVTETKTERGAERPWRVRKEEQLAHLAHASKDSAALKAADSLHNAETTLRDLEANGRAAWSRFKAPANEQICYYGEVARTVAERLGDHALARELQSAVDRLARHV